MHCILIKKKKHDTFDSYGVPYLYVQSQLLVGKAKKKLRLALFYIIFVHPLFSSVEKEINPHCN